MRALKGQATLEFLLMFLSSLAFITLLLGAMALAMKNATLQADAIEKTLQMEELIRAYEVHYSSGIIMVLSIENKDYLPEGSRIRQDYEGKSIIVEGIMDNASERIEPV